MTSLMPDDPSADPQYTARLYERAGLALLRLETGLVPQRARRDAREYLEEAGKKFDGHMLVDFCLEGRAGDGEAGLAKGLNLVRSRLIGEAFAERGPRRRGRLHAFGVRMAGRFAGQLVFFLIQTFVILALLVVLKRAWPAADLYELAGRGLDALSSLIR